MQLTETVRHAERRAREGKTLPLAAILAAFTNRDDPVKLARALTWVGADVPGGQRAVGFWPGGTERATVTASDDPEGLAARFRQKSALWFTPGEGADVLHVVRTKQDATAVRAGLARHGVTYLTVVPRPGGSDVHVVDQGGEQAGAVRAWAAESGGEHRAIPGAATFRKV